MEKIKIGYFADGPWSHLAFEKIIQDKSIEVLFIVPRNDTKDMTLKGYAEQYSIDYISKAYVNRPDFIEKVKSYKPDLLVSMSYNQIFKKEIIESVPLNIINCHAGKLPFYRGRNILNWCLINDEKDFGITVHFVDEGIDTGDIILQRIYPITDEDNYQTLLDSAYKGCASIIYDGIKLLQKGNYERIPQKTIHSVGMYCGERKEGDEWLNWNQTSRDIFNFVRAICKPGPMAHTRIEGSKSVLKINKVKLIEQAPVYKGVPGQVIGKGSKSFIVKTKDSFIEILDWNIDDVKLRVGTRLH